MSNPAVFIKKNPLPGSRSLACEREGLELLRKYKRKHRLNIPAVLGEDAQGLKLEKIISIPPTPDLWMTLGQGVAKLHQIQDSAFGFKSDNFIGLKPQLNTLSLNWGEFFFENRLSYQVKLVQKESLRLKWLEILSARRLELIAFLNAHSPTPSLLHGDLWSGNVMFSAHGPWLIDPAVYFGDSECDLAMTKMFGGFDPMFYEGYHSVNPVVEGCEKRLIIYNLYHFLNHYNIFGDNYVEAVDSGFAVIHSL